MNELIHVTYDLVVRADENDGKTLTGYIVPWDKPTFVVKPIAGYEVFKRGSVKRGDKPVSLHALHNEGSPIGRLERAEDDATGLLGTFRLFDSQAATDARELVREGIWTSLSIGAYVTPSGTKVTRSASGTRIERSEVVLDHVALLRKPAYEDAKVLALREQDTTTNIKAVVAARQRIRNRLLAPTYPQYYSK